MAILSDDGEVFLHGFLQKSHLLAVHRHVFDEVVDLLAQILRHVALFGR